MSELVELQLRKPGAGDVDSSVWKSVLQNTLRIIVDITRESDAADTTALRAALAEYRTMFSRQMHPQEERQFAAECVSTCEQYLQHVERDHKSRESELLELVALLREAATRLLGDSSSFNSRLESTADRFRMISRLEEIKDLKQQLTLEVSSLEKLVEEKKERDQQAMSSLSERVSSLQSDLEKAEEQALTDALTKVPNRGAFDRTLQKWVEDALKSETPLTLAMIDVDHFKAINDAHGHPIGDRVLVCTAEWLRNAVRHTDFIARYGGEEFAILLKDADLRNAESRLAQVGREIASRSYQYEADGEVRSIRFTVSGGVAQLSAQDSPDDLVQRADQALYEAKQKGRNRVIARKASRFARLLSMK